MTHKKNFLDLELAELQAWCQAQGQASFRARQLYQWQTKGLGDFQEMSNLPPALREQLGQDFWPGLPEIRQEQSSRQGDSQKFLFAYPDGETIEAVLMLHNYGHSACLSSQIGCRMACRFCASTGLAIKRNLTRGDLLGQFLALEKHTGQRISNLDLMGIGEPLDNYTEVLAFIRRLLAPDFRNFSVRKISLSTCGLIEGIYALAEEGLGLTLAISLHAPDQALREQLMPIAKRNPLPELLAAADYYFQKTGRRISYEYALFGGVNDSLDQARALARLLQGRNCHVNLIPANEVEGSPFQPSPPSQVQAFLAILEKQGINATLRRSLGQDIEAACGQLRRRSLLAGPASK
ncbi:MAG: 23S rRNA (adenine(2503)-C(2))-methyltransferase RlmN [Eubacteriales bacterium]|nr:23S rRNA (adenine(2503)-C(2))-methyltransferase RlmN [Eubacteriales bacterium]